MLVIKGFNQAIPGSGFPDDFFLHFMAFAWQHVSISFPLLVFGAPAKKPILEIISTP
jgi:hypothetical protein